ATHQSLEDVAIMRAIPRLRVYQPCDARETEAVIRHVAEIKGPCYVRLGRANVDDVYEGEVPDVTKVHVLRQGEKVALLATGYEVQQVLKAADILKEQGINATVVDIACIKPIDEEGVIDILKNHEHVFTVEEHSIVGGFGSAVCEVACNKYPHIIHRIGVNDIFGESGPAMAVITKYGLDGESIARKVLETVK
ncbi:MAG: transketolase C-terminal domain-containing protein, partial [Solobacterium sp.]|nr:transketolase C-terminal domain-containing protein [Solobacterium sp.]